MAKREIIPADIAKKFSKPQYEIDQPVCFTWLGQKMYGYVKKITRTETKVSYLVETKNCKYPVGLEISGFKSSDTGNISYERTRTTSPEFIRNNITSTNFATVFTNIRREEITSTDDNRSNGNAIADTDNAVQQKRKRTKSSTKNDTKSSNRTNPKTDTKRTKNTTKKLDSKQKPTKQVEKQKDFLKKFI
jgi:hypothetical protein